MSIDPSVRSTKKLNRREMLKVLGMAAAGTALAACGPAPTPQVVEKVVTKEVEVEKVVTKEVEKVVEKEKEVIVTATAAPVETVERIRIQCSRLHQFDPRRNGRRPQFGAVRM